MFFGVVVVWLVFACAVSHAAVARDRAAKKEVELVARAVFRYFRPHDHFVGHKLLSTHYLYFLY
jgi:hypothetical protein